MGLLGGIGSFVGGIIGVGKKAKAKLAQEKADNATRLAAQKKELNRQMAAEAQQSKKTMMMVAIGGGGLLLFMMFFMKK